MSPEQFGQLLSELRTITLVVVVASVSVAVSAALAAVRTYRYVKQHVTQGLEDDFQKEAADLLERAKLESLVTHCQARLSARPNHIYAHWYLAKAYYLQERWSDALQAFESTKKLCPTWTESIDRYVDRITARSRAETTDK